MPYARIYSSPKSAMQSGKSKTGLWRLEYTTSEQRFYDPVMGWTGSDDMSNEIYLDYETFEEALNFAKSIGLDPVIENIPLKNLPQKKAYADNFRNNKPPFN